MPGPLIKPQSWDPAAIASKLPEPLRWLGGAALGGLQEISGGNDPNSMMQMGAPMMAAEGELTPFAKKGVDVLKNLYSRVSRAAEGLPEMIHPNKAMSLFKNNSSSEEIGYRKLNEFLGSKGNEMVPKGEILSHLEANPAPEISVKSKGMNPNPILISSSTDDAKYHNYQLPGGENYRENLITTSNKAKVPRPLTLEETDNLHLMSPEDRDILLNEHVWTPEQQRQTYQSPHWDEPNVLVHSRTQDRTLPKPSIPSYEDWIKANPSDAEPGHPDIDRIIDQMRYKNEGLYHELGMEPYQPQKIRNIENIQSDWHQAGAKEGYKVGPRQLVDESMIKPGHSLQYRSGEDGPAYRVVGHDEDGTVRGTFWSSSKEDVIRRHLGLEDDHRVPNAPFKDKGWLDLALKHQILDVAHNPDISGISVTPGSELVKRGEGASPQFNDQNIPNALERLLKPFGGKRETVDFPAKVEQLNWSPDTGKYGTLYKPATGEEVVSHSGIEQDMFGNMFKLKDYQAPDAAKFKAYYDANRPNSTTQAPLFQITPEMKALIKKHGLPLLSILGLANASPNQEGQ